MNVGGRIAKTFGILQCLNTTSMYLRTKQDIQQTYGVSTLMELNFYHKLLHTENLVQSVQRLTLFISVVITILEVAALVILIGMIGIGELIEMQQVDSCVFINHILLLINNMVAGSSSN